MLAENRNKEPDGCYKMSPVMLQHEELDAEISRWCHGIAQMKEGRHCELEARCAVAFIEESSAG